MSDQLPKGCAVTTFKEIFGRLQYGLTAKFPIGDEPLRFTPLARGFRRAVRGTALPGRGGGVQEKGEEQPRALEIT